MPPPIKVKLVPHDPRWAEAAAEETEDLAKALGSVLLRVHHVGSTAIPGIRAKPVLDLMPVVSSLAELDAKRSALEALGFSWWGEYGLPGRRYCTKDDPVTGDRLVQLHCYVEGSEEIERHVAFRDYMRAHADVAHAYDEEKARCQRLHPDDSHAYSDCKNDWIQRAQAEALARFPRS
ncbi:GrpB family protein [Vulgatibacter incomptus]|uniref:Glutamate-rich protein grpB n=1 Tax=Vulgatibacter incomptus TaxID=1391653 RepID=A0A0K1PGF2_9BACT|nr:GrpB family protein [Vulgatibacter incomptus]AKU92587.1 hypothetical protein AKJ08_2974 [Vulgatibacter incomptus]